MSLDWDLLPKKNRISQIDALDIGESHSFTLTFEEDPRKDVSLKSGLLEISTEWREEHMTSFFYNQLKVQSEMTHVTETVVASSGRNLAIQVPKAPAQVALLGSRQLDMGNPG